MDHAFHSDATCAAVVASQKTLLKCHSTSTVASPLSYKITPLTLEFYVKEYRWIKCGPWAEFVSELQQNDLGYCINTWVKYPLVIRNQQLLKMDKNFIKSITGCRTAASILSMVQQTCKMREIESVLCHKES